MQILQKVISVAYLGMEKQLAKEYPKVIKLPASLNLTNLPLYFVYLT